MKSIRIGNAAGFWGDSPSAPRQLVASGNLDYLTLEYLAELTMSILAHQKKKNQDRGFVTEVPAVVDSIIDQFRDHGGFRMVTNGGGMNPSACAAAVARVLKQSNQSDLEDLPIGIVTGDDINSRLDQLIDAGEDFSNIETGESISGIRDRIASANVYLGASGIVDCLENDARIILTGRVADASLVVGPALFEHGWNFDEFEKLARATVAGHLIECGAQVTGGIFSEWNDQLSLGDIGYPIAIIDPTGDCQITKPENSGGVVSTKTCAEQLVYEIGDPKKYMTPDVIADFSRVQFSQASQNLVKVTGGTGKQKPDQLKVSIAYHDGYIASGMIVVAGRRAAEKATAAGHAIQQKLSRDGIQLDEYHFEILGCGDSAPGMRLHGQKSGSPDPWEVVLRVTGRSQHRENTDRMMREVAPLVTSGPPGVTGYTGARGKSQPVLSFWPALVGREHIEAETIVRSAKEWIAE